ncbi:UDP-N-acetylmuramoyl-tripeptide--D-alanyl-D-alanine ligase [Jiangella aurantiaca]|uniref:UDP-N-acetylmuramoyl-tripeptide--D-alanyl-D-alanine ligase n=1 Tax=Jiangella aurantiaca TaxID=2530373 RepID=A0A4R5AFG2_9ACTN|nr:UDP-N-acetylmuramoyl-tripeptide--D-alanyl-D-alanine ligase [Jiangella aurantiaca]TDD69624.1 UDP-N-acetylmuramoyl-tripeptide--D-alanyl-D-alanine ligase [Jiangella aurantiaca]
MIPLTLAEVASATGGRLDAVADPAVRVTGPVVTDSRELEPGGLFVARRGEAQDGHDFASAAIDAGAVAVLAARPVGVPAVVVDDTEVAFGRLARAVLDKLNSGLGGEANLDRLPQVTVVGVTGSSGKTTTKDLLAQVLEPLGPLVAPPGSYNSEVGVPLTVLRIDESTRTLVVEMGARRPGHIAYLCGIAPPRVGLVLNVGSAHLGEFGDRETIARTKAELVEALPPAAEGGVAVLNADDQVVRRMAERTEAQVVMVGESVHADVRAEDVALDAAGRASFRLVTTDGEARVSLRLVGEHQVSNALAVAGAALSLGVPLDEVASRLSAALPRSRWRMEVTERPDGVTVVNDAYNANPESMRAALKTLASLRPAGSGRTWAVLGEMLELGESSIAEHDAIGRLAVRLNVSRLVAVGDGARAIHQGASLEGSWDGESVWVPDVDAALELLRAELRPGDVVLVKSSRDAGLRFLGERLVEDK